MLLRVLLLFTCLLIFTDTYSNNTSVDSLIDLAKLSKNDSTTITLQLKIAQALINTDPESAQIYAEEALSISDNIYYQKGKLNALKLLRQAAYFQKNYLKQFIVNKKLENIYRGNRDTAQMFQCVFYRLLSYRGMKEYDSAKVCLNELKELNIAMDNEKDLEILNQTGNLFWHMKQIDSAEVYYRILSERSIKENRLDFSNNAIHNLASIAFARKEFLKSKNLYLSLLDFDNHNPTVRIENYFSVSSAYYHLGMDDSSKYYDYKCIALAKQLNQKNTLLILYGYMLDRYKEENIEDSIYLYMGLEGESKIALGKQDHSLNLKKLRIKESLDNTKRIRQKIKDEETAEVERTIYIGIIGFIGFCAILILVGYYYLRSRNKRKIIESKRKEIIEKKREVEEKNKSFIQNFKYAKSIQEAVLPGNNLEKAIPDSFVYYKPRDIVSGDFYWVSKTVKNKVLIAVGDCTGHGVPGALMSIMGTAFINEVVSEDQNVSPAKLLEELRQRVIDGLQQKGEVGEARDGMDISICLVDTKTNELEFSGANNPMYLVRDKELMIIDANPQPIGYYINSHPFTEKSVKLKKGDVMYLTTDGYQDQFGGPRGRKFMKKKLKEMFVEISAMSLKEQESYIDKTMIDWMGEEFQVDDMCILGFKV